MSEGPKKRGRETQSQSHPSLQKENGGTFSVGFVGKQAELDSQGVAERCLAESTQQSNG